MNPDTAIEQARLHLNRARSHMLDHDIEASDHEIGLALNLLEMVRPAVAREEVAR